MYTTKLYTTKTTDEGGERKKKHEKCIQNVVMYTTEPTDER
jgi:hypothetical protein